MKSLLKNLAQLGEKQVWLAISGGIDSMVLLDVYAKLYQGNQHKLKVLHVNHHIHPDSDKWASLVKKTAEGYGLEVMIEDIQVGKSALEETARELRYQAMFQHMDKEDVLLTAHHLDDQKETFVFRAFRGTGLKGLVGIRALHTLHGYQIRRPFYQIPKKELQDYATMHQLKWVEDPSNQSHEYKRNEIRHALSQIKTTDSFALTQMHLERQAEVFSHLLDEKLSRVLIEPHIVNMDLLLKEDPKVQLELFHHWLSSFSQSLSYHRTCSLYHSMMNAKEDRYPMEKMGEYTLLRYRDSMTLLVLPQLDLSLETQDEWLDLKALGKIHNPNRDHIHLKLLGDQKGRYKKKLQNLNIPLWLRHYIPMINGKLVIEHKDYRWLIPQKWQYWFRSSLKKV